MTFNIFVLGFFNFYYVPNFTINFDMNTSIIIDFSNLSISLFSKIHTFKFWSIFDFFALIKKKQMFMFHNQTSRQESKLSHLFRLGTPGLTSQARARHCTRPCETGNSETTEHTVTCGCNDSKRRRFVHCGAGWCWRGAPQFWKDTCIDIDFSCKHIWLKSYKHEQGTCCHNTEPR